MILLLKKHQILVIRPLNPTLSKNVQTIPESSPLCITFSNFVKLFDGGVQYCLSKGNLEQKIIYLNKKTIVNCAFYLYFMKKILIIF